MKKKKTHTSVNAKPIIAFIIIQIIILTLFAYVLYDALPISPKKVNCAYIQVDDIKNVRRFNEFRVCVYTEDENYEFPNFSAFSELSKDDLIDKIKEEGQISIKYVKTFGGFRRYNLIVDARSESEVYLSLDDYNANRPIVGVIILFVIIEILIFGIFVVYDILYHRTRFSIKQKKNIKSHKNSIK